MTSWIFDFFVIELSRKTTKLPLRCFGANKFKINCFNTLTKQLKAK